MAIDIFCIFCKLTVSMKESEFDEHMRTVHDITTHLDILLALSFATKHEKDSIVLKHKHTVKNTGIENYFTCIFCNIDHQGRVFTLDKSYELNLHLEENHAIFNEHEFILIMHVMEDLNEIETILFKLGNPSKCPKCNKPFTSISSFEHHIKIHEEKKLNVNSMESEKLYLQDGITRNMGQTDLINVKNEPITKEEKYKIKQVNLAVNKSLFYKPNTKGLPKFCGQCQKGFSTRLNLKYHMLGHTGEKPLVCLECGSRFKIGNLKRHMFTHTKEKPYNCKICEAGYTSLHALKYHKATHTEEKQFGCNQCEKLFRAASHLKTHMLSHTGEKQFACNQCEKVYYQAGNLKTHILAHLGERPFACTQCDKACFTSGALKRHKLTHTGEKLFACNQCQKVFSWKHGLKKHKLSHVGKK